MKDAMPTLLFVCSAFVNLRLFSASLYLLLSLLILLNMARPFSPKLERANAPFVQSPKDSNILMPRVTPSFTKESYLSILILPFVFVTLNKFGHTRLVLVAEFLRNLFIGQSFLLHLNSPLIFGFPA